MPQTTSRDLEGGHNLGMWRSSFQLVLPNFTDVRTDEPYEQHQSASNPSFQELDRDTRFRDGSWPLFSMYSNIAEEEDNKLAERWQKDADEILIFVRPSSCTILRALTHINYYQTGFFTVAVAVLLTSSTQDLRPNPQDTSAFYLANIYQILADPNTTVPPTSVPSAVAIPPPFSPPRYAVWVNSLWFLSFVIGLTCGLLATLSRQWARRYVAITQPPRCSPENRARMRAFFSNGVDKMHLPWAIEALSVLLHLSLLLFFSGLVIFLFNIDRTIFTSVIWWIGLFTIIYGWITLMPVFRHDSPYYAPLSSTAWTLYTSIQHTLFASLVFITWRTSSYQSYFLFRDLRNRYRHWISVGIRQAVEDTSMTSSPETDVRILNWTIGSLVDDDSLEKYFGTIPGFAKSNTVKIPGGELPFAHFKKFWVALCGFLGRTLSLDPLNESVKARRLIKCLNAMDVIPCPSHVQGFLYRLIDERLGQIPLSIETGHTLTRCCTNNDGNISQSAQYCVIRILMTVEERDDRWIALAKKQFGLPEHRLQYNLAYGNNSALLSILIHVIRQVIRADPSKPWLLSSLSNFDIHDTLPGLQNEFCALWNEIVLEAKRKESDDDDDHLVKVLREIRHVYIALHQGTDDAPTTFSAHTHYLDPILVRPSSYPLCNNTFHQPDSIPRPLIINPSDIPPPTHHAQSVYPSFLGSHPHGSSGHLKVPTSTRDTTLTDPAYFPHEPATPPPSRSTTDHSSSIRMDVHGDAPPPSPPMLSAIDTDANIVRSDDPQYGHD